MWWVWPLKIEIYSFQVGNLNTTDIYYLIYNEFQSPTADQSSN